MECIQFFIILVSSVKYNLKIILPITKNDSLEINNVEG